MALIENSFAQLAPVALQPVALTPPATGRGKLLDPGFNLTLRPMRYPAFYEMFRNAIRNTWTVEEIDLSDDLVDLDRKLLPAEKQIGRAHV